MSGSEKCTHAPPWAFAAANSPPWQLRIGLRDRRAVALERVLVDERQHTVDDVVEVYGTADFLAFAYHATNGPDDFTRPMSRVLAAEPLRDEQFDALPHIGG